MRSLRRIIRTAIITLIVCLALITLTTGVLFLALTRPNWAAPLYLMNVAIRHDTPNIPYGFSGMWRRWDQTGTLIYEGRFDNGSPVGTHLAWWSDGSKCSSDVYEGTNRVRSQMWYRANGSGHSQLKVDANFAGDPIRVVTYHKNGQRKKDVLRSVSQQSVHVRQWDEQGQLVSETTNTIPK